MSSCQRDRGLLQKGMAVQAKDKEPVSPVGQMGFFVSGASKGVLKKWGSDPSTSLRYAQGERNLLIFPLLPFVLSVALRAKSKHERVFQQPAKGVCLCFLMKSLKD